MASPESAVEALLAACRVDSKLEGVVYIQISLKEKAVDRREPHPLLIPLPHRFRRKEESMTCLVVTDPGRKAEESLQQFKPTSSLFDEVIGVGKLRRRITTGKRPDHAKRLQGEMCRAQPKRVETFARAFGMIFVQHKVAQALTEAMGLGYLKHGKHLPVPLKIDFPLNEASALELSHVVKRALRCTQLVLRPDANDYTIRVGHTKMDTKKLVENIEKAVKELQERIPRGLGRGAQYFVRTAESASLKLG